MNSLTVVGPLPPPLSGTPVSFAVFCEEVQRLSSLEKLYVVDSSPKYLKQSRYVKFSARNILQAGSIVFKYLRVIGKSKRVLVFGSAGYVVSMAPVLLLLAKLFRRPFFFRSFGGVLDDYIRNLNPFFFGLAKWCLRNCDGVIVETELLMRELKSLLGTENVYYVPGYRSMPELTVRSGRTKSGLKLAFVGIVKREKGVFDLLAALDICQLRSRVDVSCTFYGSIHEPDKENFNQKISEVSSAEYGGELDWQDVISTLGEYDALVLPTFYEGEGHPGVLIEAMMAGIAIIATDFRSIPEIVKSEYNGLLFQAREPGALADVITRIYSNPDLLRELAANNRNEAEKYKADLLVSKILEIAFNESGQDLKR